MSDQPNDQNQPQPDIEPAGEQEAENEGGQPLCADERDLPDGRGHVKCTRFKDHLEDHFDEHAGIGWYNEGGSVAGLTQEERVHKVLDSLGVPRNRNENIFSLVQRTNLFVDRISRRLYDQVENNMILFNTCRDVVTLLEGAPNSGNFRTRTALEKLRQVTSIRRPGSKLIVQ